MRGSGRHGGHAPSKVASVKGFPVRLRVMVVDDSAEVRSALGRIIYQQPDLEIVAVSSGVDDGVAMVQQLLPDVVILDVNMPDGGGLRAAREISASTPGVRIIAFSAFDRALIRKAMMAAGATAYISKSGDVRDLLREILGVSEPEEAAVL
jgi:DNA-binding NarL/FixJ family response regulator